MRDPSPPALSASCPQSSGSGVTDPHLLPLAPEAMPLPTRPRRARQQRRGSGAVMPAFQCLAFQSVITDPGLTTTRRVPEPPPSPQARALQSQPRSLLRPSSGFERPAAAGFPPADTPVGVTWAAPPPPPLAGSSPFGQSRICHPRVPLGEGWKRPAAVANSSGPRGPLAAGGAALSPAPASPGATSPSTAHNKGNM